MAINEPKVLNDNGAWCWFQGERAIIHGQNVLFGSCADGSGAGGATRDGNIELTAWNSVTNELQRTMVHEHFQDDDHVVPAIHVRQDGRILIIYGAHGLRNLRCPPGANRQQHWRISTKPGDIGEFGPLQTFDFGNGYCYQNTYRLAAEKGRLYNFFRGTSEPWQLNPHYTISDDDGATWRYGGQFLFWPRPVGDPKFTGMDGGRPYPRYASNNNDTIHVLVSEDHPRAYDNSIYHGFIRSGKVFRSDGELLGNLSTSPGSTIRPTDLTRVFAGDADNVAWTTDLRLDVNGLPYAAFSVRKNDGNKRNESGIGGEDLRYHFARFDGKKWRQNEIAYAGQRLYPAEGDYTGLVALHPHDPDRLYISANVDPGTGAPLISRADGKRHYEIFRGCSSDEGTTWSWTPLTQNSITDNLRPIIPPGDPRKSIILWFRGVYRSYSDYSTEVLGLVDAF